ncbi:hypothetical protein [Komagataeibacter rhaeticus]|uniref:hypothetical protein n=1 Tax=Komagataeibacter rhaeticus TaxID=215221 RepID=UPI0004D523EC|nr:hypothetical protein [Komagataeibacter rhaeticus]KDU96430.1 hypothetical protein GLUCORHAEAF1_02530 [Komagataeibacter rhaeticus AF1]GBQ10820.1 hypothetical protein AA16663_0632 [Komagataeibacter rhaeticus DSM 16663]
MSYQSGLAVRTPLPVVDDGQRCDRPAQRHRSGLLANLQQRAMAQRIHIRIMPAPPGMGVRK